MTRRPPLPERPAPDPLSWPAPDPSTWTAPDAPAWTAPDALAWAIVGAELTAWTVDPSLSWPTSSWTHDDPGPSWGDTLPP